jgi:hypothetical protein
MQVVVSRMYGEFERIKIRKKGASFQSPSPLRWESILDPFMWMMVGVGRPFPAGG